MLIPPSFARHAPPSHEPPQVWSALEGTGAGLQDYALAPSGEADLDFFCTDWSNELLEAAGIRNDDGDYFKVWGGRVGCGAGRAVGGGGRGC
jgi:hypothetical protein